MAIYFLLGTLTNEGQRMLHNNPDLVSDTAATLEVEGSEDSGAVRSAGTLRLHNHGAG